MQLGKANLQHIKSRTRSSRTTAPWIGFFIERRKAVLAGTREEKGQISPYETFLFKHTRDEKYYWLYESLKDAGIDYGLPCYHAYLLHCEIYKPDKYQYEHFKCPIEKEREMWIPIKLLMRVLKEEIKYVEVLLGLGEDHIALINA